MSSLRERIAQNVLDSLPVGLLIVDQAGRCLTVNPAAATILGHSQADLLGRGLGELFFTDPANVLFGQVFVDVIQNELVGLSREVPYRTPGGPTRQLSLIGSYLHDDAAAASSVVVIVHDITELVRMRRREAEVLLEMNRVQEEKIRCLSRLAASVAHQIRNPAAAIGGFAVRLDRQLKAKGLASDYPGIILDEARRLEGLVRTVGRFAALAHIRLAPAALAPILAEARGLAEQRAASLGREIRWRMEAPELSLVVDPTLLATALGELFRNAVEYAGPAPVTITVTGQASPEQLELTVADDGPGVAPLDAPHIFDPFYSSRPDGTGMGLTLVQEILVEHGGRVRLDREGQTQGARFVLTLPLFPRQLASSLDRPPS